MATPSTSAVERTLETLEGEVGRRLVHSSGALVPALYLIGVIPWRAVIGLFVLGTLVATVLEILRLSGTLELWVHRHLTREYERDSVAGYFLYMFAAAAVTIVFVPTVATPAIFMLALADPVSGMVGSGELRVVKRPVALLTMFLACAAIAAPFHYTTPLVVFLGGLGGMIADGVKPQFYDYVIDDNLSIPILAAGAMQLGLVLTDLL